MAIAAQELGQQRQREIELRRPPFEAATAVEFRQTLQDKDEHKPGKLYFRDGDRDLGDFEAQIGELVDVDPKIEGLLCCNSGMSAENTACGLALLTKGDKILYGNSLYSQSLRLFREYYPKRGIESIPTDPELITDVVKGISIHRPKLVFFEIVSNTPEMSVLDAERLLEQPVLREVNPVIILDNTLPTNTILPLAQIMRRYPDLKLVGIESLTKFYALNRELGGIIFTPNKDLRAELFALRTMFGSTLGPSAVHTIEEVLPDKKEFNRANGIIAKNTLDLAKACARAEDISGKFITTHPNFPYHASSKLANSISEDGITPVFFLQAIDPSLSHAQLADIIWEDVLKERGHYAQSFGFGRTGISYDLKTSYVRIAGGMETPKEMADLTYRLERRLSNL